MGLLTNKFRQKGQLLLEILIAFGVASILLPAIFSGFLAGRDNKVQQTQRTLALGLLKEEEEAVRSVREADWSNVSTNGTYYPKVVSGKWSLSTNSSDSTINGFTRSVTIASAFRDVNQHLSGSGTPEPSAKYITLLVSWGSGSTKRVTTSYYLTRWGNVTSSLTSGGTLAGMGHGDWCSPNLHLTPYDISGNGIGIAISSTPGSAAGLPNGAFITTGNNASSYSLYSLNISDPDYPTVPVVSTAHTYNNGKDYGLYSNSSYVYVATGNVPGDSKRVVDIVNPTTLTKVGYFDASSNLNATSVAIDGNQGYVTAGTNNSSSTYLIAFTANPVVGTASQGQLWSKQLTNNAVGNKVIVSAGYAYIATSATTGSLQLQVVNLSAQTIYTPPASGIGSINTSQPGVDLTISGNYLYLVTKYSATSPNVFAIDISNPAAPKVVGSTSTQYSSTSMDPLGVAAAPYFANKLIVVGDGGWQYQVFDVTDPTNISKCGTPLQNPNGASKIQAVSTLREVDGDVYSYILTTNSSSQQLQIIEGGSGGAGGNGGVFESPVFDAGHSVVFNNFAVTSLTPSGVNANFQIAISSDCTTFSYFGNYGSTGGAIPVRVNPGQCFKYRVTFTNAGGATSASVTVAVNYSP